MPRERRPYEYRVGLTPAAVRYLTDEGHTIYVEDQAGKEAGLSNERYEQAGATIVYEEDEIYTRPELLVKISRPTYEEIDLMREGLAVMGIMFLHASKRDKIETIMRKKLTFVGLEIVEQGGFSPIRGAVARLSGSYVPFIAGQLLSNLNGGSGVVLGGNPGIPPAEVVIVGAGNSGTAMARKFIDLGAQVTVLDINLRKLEQISQMTGSKIVTMMAIPYNLEKVVAYADVLITTAQVTGQQAPVIITAEMVKSMRPRSVIIDLAIDQGGNCETSHPTHHGNPTYVEHGVIHYCVPNIGSVVARSSSYAFNNALMGPLIPLAKNGLQWLKHDPLWRSGVVTYEGMVVNEILKARLDSSVSEQLEG